VFFFRAYATPNIGSSACLRVLHGFEPAKERSEMLHFNGGTAGKFSVWTDIVFRNMCAPFLSNNYTFIDEF
jgi:hypothetical protein